MGTLGKLVLAIAVSASGSAFAKPAAKPARKSVSLKLVLVSDAPKADAPKVEAVKAEAPKELLKTETEQPAKTAEEVPAAPVKPAAPKKSPKKMSAAKPKARAIAATPEQPKRTLKKRVRKPASIGEYEKSTINFNGLIYNANVRQNKLSDHKSAAVQPRAPEAANEPLNLELIPKKQ